MKVVCTFRYDVMVIVMVIVIRHLLIIHNPFFRLPCLLTMPISLSLFINFSTPRRLIPIRSAASVAVNEGLEFSNKRSRLSFIPNFIPYFIPNSSPNFIPNSLSIESAIVIDSSSP